MILVKYQTSIQVSENDFKVIWVEKLFNEYTTLSEIFEWERNKKLVNIGGLIITKPEV